MVFWWCTSGRRVSNGFKMCWFWLRKAGWRRKRGKKRGRVRGNCDLRSFHQTSVQIFRCSWSACVCNAARPESSDIIAFLVKEPDGLEVPKWRAPVKPASWLWETFDVKWGKAVLRRLVSNVGWWSGAAGQPTSQRRHASLFLNVLKRFYYLCHSLARLWLSLNIQVAFNRSVPSHVFPTRPTWTSSATFQQEHEPTFSALTPNEPHLHMQISKI